MVVPMEHGHRLAAEGADELEVLHKIASLRKPGKFGSDVANVT